MSDNKDLKHAKEVYASLCQKLDEHEWHYERYDDELTISCGAQGEDLPIELTIEVDAERQLVLLLSNMPFKVPENRRTALAIAISQANNGMVDGSFDFDYLSGKIIFRLTSSYRDSVIGKEMFTYMLMCACSTIDHYNDKFLVVAKSDMTSEEILQYVQ